MGHAGNNVHGVAQKGQHEYTYAWSNTSTAYGCTCEVSLVSNQFVTDCHKLAEWAACQLETGQRFPQLFAPVFEHTFMPVAKWPDQPEVSAHHLATGAVKKV